MNLFWFHAIGFLTELNTNLFSDNTKYLNADRKESLIKRGCLILMIQKEKATLRLPRNKYLVLIQNHGCN
jgi:hypothetical protein